MDDNTGPHHAAFVGSQTSHGTNHWNRHLPSRRTKSSLLIVLWSCQSIPPVCVVGLPTCKADTTWRQSTTPFHLCLSIVKKLLVAFVCLMHLVVLGVGPGINTVYERLPRLHNLTSKPSCPAHHTIAMVEFNVEEDPIASPMQL